VHFTIAWFFFKLKEVIFSYESLFLIRSNHALRQISSVIFILIFNFIINIKNLIFKWLHLFSRIIRFFLFRIICINQLVRNVERCGRAFIFRIKNLACNLLLLRLFIKTFSAKWHVFFCTSNHFIKVLRCSWVFEIIICIACAYFANGRYLHYFFTVGYEFTNVGPGTSYTGIVQWWNYHYLLIVCCCLGKFY